jgi:hypothetical protein
MQTPQRSGTQTEDVFWDAMSVLSIVNPDRNTITCVGYAPTRKRRCRIRVSLVGIEKTLNKLSTQYPSRRRMEADLRGVAKGLLCRRYHQDQVDGVVETWLDLVDCEKRRLRDQGIDPPQRSTQPSRVQSDDSTVTVDQVLDFFRNDMIPADTLREVLRRCETILDSERRPSPNTSSGSSTRTPIPSQAHATRTADAPCTPRPACVNHARRRPPTESCCICTDPCGTDALVWCRASCGNNVHRACFRTWRQTCEESSQPLRCVYWYVLLALLLQLAGLSLAVEQTG